MGGDSTDAKDDFKAFEAQEILPLLAEARWDDALDKCLQAYQEAIYRYVVSMLDARGISAPESTAQDIVLETFLTAWRHFATFDQSSTVRTWLFGIAINTRKNFLAQLANRSRLEKENFARIFTDAGLTWLREELPRTPTLAQKWQEELRWRHTEQCWEECWEEYRHLIPLALRQLQRRSTFYHFLIKTHICEGRSFTWIAHATGRSRYQIPKLQREFAQAKTVFCRLFVALLDDSRKESGL